MVYDKEILNLNKLTNQKKGGKYLLGMLQNLYCSCQSEFSAFLLFNYQSLTLKNKELTKILDNFSKQHLENSKQLGSLILKENGLPFYLNSQHSPLTAFWLQFDTDINKVLQIDINFLTRLIDNYSIYITKIKKEKVLQTLINLKNISINNLNILKEFNANKKL